MHKERMKENFEIFDFELTEEDRRAIHRLDTGKLKVDHNDPVLAKFLLDYDKNFNPSN